MHVFLQSLVDATSLGSLYALLALGVALTFGIMGLVNFAYGEIIMVGGYVIYVMTGSFWVLVVVGVIVVAVSLALLMERAAFRPVRGADATTMMITSFAVSILLVNTVILIFGAQGPGVSFGGGAGQQFSVGGITVRLMDIVSFATTVFLLVGVATFMKATALGVEMRASAEDFQMARLMGIPANRIIASAFALSGLLAGSVAVILVAETGAVTPQMGLGPLLIGLVATVIGGMRSLVGAVIGGYIMGFLTTGLDVALPSEIRQFRDAFVYAGVILILMLWPDGLMGPKVERSA